MSYRLGETGKTELRGYRDGAQRNGRSLFPKSIRNWAAQTLVEIPLRPVPYLVSCGGDLLCMVPAVMSHGPPRCVFLHWGAVENNAEIHRVQHAQPRHGQTNDGRESLRGASLPYRDD